MWDCYRVKNGKKSHSSKKEKEQKKTGGTEGKLIEVENLKNMNETLHLLKL